MIASPRRGPSTAHRTAALTVVVSLGLFAGAASAQQAAPWTVKVDPPAEPLKLPEEAGYAVAIPGGAGVLYPNTPSPFVALGKNEQPTDVRQVVDLRTRAVVGTIRGKVAISREAKLSPDGQYLLTEVTGGPPSQSRSVAVLSTRTGAVARTFVASPTPAFIGLLGFGAGNLAVTSRYVGKGDQVSVWDVASGKLAREFLAPPSFEKDGVAFSPGGRYLALVSNDPNLVVFDLTTGAKAAEVPVPKDKGHLQVEGLAFSPDGKELGGVFQGGGNTRLLVWDVAKGEIVVDYALKGSLKLTVQHAQAYEGGALEWLPDGSAWLLYGHTLIDRAGGRRVWTFRPGPGDFNPCRCVLVDEDRMLAAVGPANGKRLEVVTLPWAKIDGSLKAIEAKAPAIVRPGESVSLKVEVGTVRFGTQAEARAGIIKTLTERLASDGIGVAEGRPAVLHARYSESAGKTLQVVKSNGPLPGFRGTPTGQTVQATQATCQIALEVAGAKAPIWSERLEFNPSNLIVHGEPTDAKAREAAFGVLKVQLNQLPMPYFLPRDPAMATLPGVSVLTATAPRATNRATVRPTTRGKTGAK